MIVELGNRSPKRPDGSPADLGAPSVTRVHIPDSYTRQAIGVEDFGSQLVDSILRRGGITSGLPEALLALCHPGQGLWASHSFDAPTWVDSDDPSFAAAIRAFHKDVPALGKPADVEDTHYTYAGPPGVVPGARPPLSALLVNSGLDMVAKALGGSQAGYTATSTGTGATSLTDGAATWTVNQWSGARVFCGGVWANVVSNSATVLTLDRWYNPATPGGSAGATPGATTVYVIADGNSPAWFVALGNTNTAPSATDVSLSDEITSAGGGLVRKIAPFAHTAGTSTYTLTPVYTANGSDALPVTVYRIGVFSSMVVSDTTGTMMFETLLSASATLSAPGDQLTVTEQVTT